MGLFNTLLLLRTLLIFAIPSSLAESTSGKTFTLKQVPVKRQSQWSSAKSVRRAHLKYHLEVPKEVEEAANIAAPPGQATVPTRSFNYDQMYIINVQVGNHNMSLDLDTGSSDLWVISTLQPAEQRGKRPPTRVYDPKTSTAKRLEGHSWRMSYGDESSASGQVYLDKVGIGGLVVPRQAVQAATTMSRKFVLDNGHDGLFGFGASKSNSIKPKSQLTWFDNIRSELAAPLFTSSLKRRAAGSFDFGFIDKNKYKGEIVWTKVRGHRGFWDFNPTGFAIGDGEVHAASFEAIADTGSSLWYLPKTIANAYWAQVPGANYSTSQASFVFPCKSNLPEMTVIVSGKRVTVPGINMNYQPLSKTLCRGGINRDFGMPFSIFGDAFLKALFVVHEAPAKGPMRLGFAAQA